MTLEPNQPDSHIVVYICVVNMSMCGTIIFQCWKWYLGKDNSTRMKMIVLGFLHVKGPQRFMWEISAPGNPSTGKVTFSNTWGNEILYSWWSLILNLTV